MVYNPLSYFLFLFITYLVFYLCPDHRRRPLLLFAGYLFYVLFNAVYLLAALIVVTCISYVCGIRMAEQQDLLSRKRWFLTGISVCLATLAIFKYLHGFELFLHDGLGVEGILPVTITSIGVSYYTFQAISYLVDVYLEVEEAERHFGQYALYLSFFPKLLQGPIERAGDLIPQLKRPYRFDYDACRSGLFLFTWGMFKKVVLADRIALYADKVFDNVHDFSGLALVIGIYAYALQIYFDFAGYTDMARGAARLFGINLTENFNSPYLATSIADFWRRWHITFSRWILDYIFAPLQMAWRNKGQAGTAAALLITFFVSGIWHGATVGFVIWGLLHGVYLAVSIYYRPYQKKLHKLLGVEKSRLLNWWQVLVTFNLVSFSWVFFRARNLGDAWYMVKNLFNGVSGVDAIFSSRGALENGITLIVIFIMLLVAVMKRNVSFSSVSSLPSHVRWSLYVMLPVAILLLYTDSNNTFIYFKF